MKSITVKISTSTIVYLLLFVALVLRLYNLNHEGLWNDELFTADSASPYRSLDNIISLLQLDIHPPLHNILSHYWITLFSYNDTSLRMFNVLLGVFGAFSVFKLAKLLFNKKVALYALLLVVVNSYLIRYSQEVRGYALLFLLANFSIYFYTKLTRRDLSKKNIIGYALVTATMFYTHYFGLIVFAAQLISFPLVVNWQTIRANFLKYSIAFLSPCILYLFWVPSLIDHMNREFGQWRAKPSPRLIVEYFQEFFNDYIISTVALFLFGATGLYFIIKPFVKLKKVEKLIGDHSKELTILFIWGLIYFLFPYIKSSISTSMMVPRYFIGMVGPIIILVAFYLSKIKVDKLRNGVLTGLMVYSLLILFLKDRPYYTQYTSYREIAQEAKAINNDAPVLYICVGRYLLDYYLYQNKFKYRESDLRAFTELVKRDNPQEYFMFRDLRFTPEQFKNGVPVIEGYEEVYSKIFSNKFNIKTVKLVQYRKKTE